MKKCLFLLFILIIAILFYNNYVKESFTDNVIIDQLYRDGYLIIPNMLSSNECDDILNTIKSVEKGNPKFGNIHANKNRKDMMLPVYKVKSHIKKIYEKYKDLWNKITPNPILCECSSLISYPNAKHQIWHTDTSYKSGDATLVSIGIALQDIDENMGPLHVFKGSTEIYDKSKNDDSSSSSSSSSSSGKQSVENICKQLNYEEVHCLAKKGDLVIWLSSVVHRGSKNTSNKSRSVFYFSLLSSKGNRPNGSTYSLIKNYKKLYVKDF